MTFDSKLFQELAAHVHAYENKEFKKECGNLIERKHAPAEVVIIEATGLLVTMMHAVKTELKMSDIVAVFYKKVFSELQMYKTTMKRVILVFDKFTPAIKDPARKKRAADLARRASKDESKTQYIKSLESSPNIKARWVSFEESQIQPRMAHVVLTHYTDEKRDTVLKEEQMFKFTIGSLMNTPSLKRAFTESLVLAATTKPFTVPVYIDFYSYTHKKCAVYSIKPFLNEDSQWQSSQGDYEHDSWANEQGEADLALVHWCRLFAGTHSVGVTCVDGDVFLLLYILACNMYNRGKVKYDEIKKTPLYWTRPTSGKGAVVWNMYAAMKALLKAEWTPLRTCICSHLLKSDYIFDKYKFLDGVGPVKLANPILHWSEDKLQEALEHPDKAAQFAEAIIHSAFGGSALKVKRKSSSNARSSSGGGNSKTTPEQQQKQEDKLNERIAFVVSAEGKLQVAQMQQDIKNVLEYYTTAFTERNEWSGVQISLTKQLSYLSL